MKSSALALCAFLAATFVSAAETNITVTRDVPYATPVHERNTLDIHAPAGAKDLPVVFWIHGGGWQAGSKADVQLKPRLFTSAGCVFVAINYRLLPQVDMTTLTRDVARALGWVHRNIAAHGGDPRRIFVMGHSAGAQLAALLCTDDRLARAEGVPFSSLKGCVPVDGDTFDVLDPVTNQTYTTAAAGKKADIELAVAAAISLFGFESGAALATVVGVLIEVPVMLLVVRIVNRSRDWYEQGAHAVTPSEAAGP